MLFERIKANKRKTRILFIITLLFFSAIGGAISYISNGNILIGCISASIFGLFSIWITVNRSKKMILKQTNAIQISEESFPNIYHIVEDMAMVAELPMPEVYLIDDPSANAFAAGIKEDNACITLTTGIINTLNREELEGVIGHEMTHIKNHDMKTMTILMGVETALSTITSFLWFRNSDNSTNINILGIITGIIAIAVAPIIMSLLEMAISRSQEYSADAGAVELTRNPQGLINALIKITNEPPTELANDGAAALFFGPVDSKKWLNSHPDTKDRIKALQQL